MTHEITILKQHTQTIQVPVPCYWTNGLRWTALTRDLSVITFTTFGDRIDLQCLHGDTKNIWLACTQESDDYTIATEEEFFEHYDHALKQLTITPILKTW